LFIPTLLLKNIGNFVEMTDKAVQLKAWQNSLASCWAAVQQQVSRLGLLSRNKIPIIVPDFGKLVHVAGLGCSTAEAVGAVPPSIV
jgi:hypothetical protein